MVSKCRTDRQGGQTAPGSADAAIDRARAALDASLGQTGLSAAMTLASHGVPAVPVGHIKRRFGFEYPEQTGRAWRFPKDLYLLRDGTWWRAGNSSAEPDNVPPPVVRWAMSEDPQSSGSILAPRVQLTGAVLEHTDAEADDVPHGRFTTGGADEDRATLDFWVVDGVVRIAEDAAFESSLSFEEWAAAHVATLIDAR